MINTIGKTIEVYFNKRSHQKALAKSAANLRSIFDNTAVAYLLLDRDFNIMAFNHRMLRVYIEVTGVVITVGANLIQLLLGDRRDKVHSIYRSVIANNKPIEYESVYTSNGVSTHFLANVIPVHDSSTVIGLCISSLDITKIKNLEKEREKIINDLVQRNTDLEQFAHIVSHNIRGPLATILGVTSILQEPIPDMDTPLLIEGIVASANRLDEVIRDLNQILQIRREIAEVKTVVNLDELITDVKNSISSLIQERNALINYDFSALPALLAVKSYLHNILYNLLTNSIKFSQPGKAPEIKIWTTTQDAAHILYIKDNGIGIDLHRQREKIFQLYQRFNLSIEGKGLGLFMTRTQVEALNGKIEVDSTLGGGTTFTITFPV